MPNKIYHCSKALKSILLTGFILLYSQHSLANSKDLAFYLQQLESHPKILSLLAQQAAELKMAEGALGLPDPSLFFGVENIPASDPSFDRYLPSSKTIGINQPLPSSTTRTAKRDIFLISASSRELLAEYTKSRLKALFFTRIADLKRVKEQLDLEEKKKNIIDQLRNYFEGQIVAGKPLYEKTFLTETQLTDVQRNINSYHAELATIEADLIQFVGEVPPTTLFLEDKIWDTDIHKLYPIQLAARNIEIAQAKVAFADSSYRPNFGILGTYKLREEGENNSFDGDDWFSIQLQITVPLWGNYNQGPKLEAAKNRKRSEEHAYRETVRKWKMETTRLSSQKKASRLNIKMLLKKDLALQEKIKAMERTYSAGQTSLEPLLQTEIARLSLLSVLAQEQARFVSFSHELNSHIIEGVGDGSK